MDSITGSPDGIVFLLEHGLAVLEKRLKSERKVA